MVYIRVSNALYEILRAALLFHKRLHCDLKNMRFIIHRHDPCAANMMTNGSHCTVYWHVDKLKGSHMDKAVMAAYLPQVNGSTQKKG